MVKVGDEVHALWGCKGFCWGTVLETSEDITRLELSTIQEAPDLPKRGVRFEERFKNTRTECCQCSLDQNVILQENRGSTTQGASMYRKYPHTMGKAEFTPPTNVKVGDVAIVLHSYTGDHLSDLRSGDSTVAEVKTNGTIVLANNMKFHADGRGHAVNGACWLSSHHAILRDSNGMPVKSATGEPFTARGETITTELK